MTETVRAIVDHEEQDLLVQLDALVEASVTIGARPTKPSVVEAALGAVGDVLHARGFIVVRKDGRVVVEDGDRAVLGVEEGDRLTISFEREGANRISGEMHLVRSDPPLRWNERLLARQLGRVIASTLDRLALLNDAQKSARDRQEIVAIVSHDLRTPLQTFGLGLDILKSKLASDGHDVEVTVSRMERAMQNMERLLGDLLDVTRIRDSMFSVHPEPQDPSVLLDTVIEQTGPIARAKGLRLEREESAIGAVSCDGPRIVQALTNLVANAVRHTDEGSIVVRARLVDDDHVRFEVIDTGSGVRPEVKSKLFERLYQDSSDGSRSGSLGLGLYIVRGIALAHGGTVGVESELGRGSTFWISIPRPAESAIERAPVIPAGMVAGDSACDS